MIQTIHEKIENIFESILLQEDKNIGLMSGSSGTILLAIEYCKYKNQEIPENILYKIQYLASNNKQLSTDYFSIGKSGINWLFAYLYKIGLLEDGDYSFLCDNYLELQYSSLELLRKGNWDFLHGALGIAYYLLFDFQKAKEDYFVLFFKELEKICQANKVMGIFSNYDMKNNAYLDNQVNVGLAHGIPSILKFCSQCYKQNICKVEAYKMSSLIIDFLLNNTNSIKGGSYFPYTVINGNKVDVTSRLAWCYGDLGTAFILFQSGKVFQNEKAIKFALQILESATKRKSYEETRISDTGFCHGSSGVAYIYYKMWHYTKDSIFKDAADFWIKKTLSWAMHTDGTAGFKKYNPIDHQWEIDYGLLEGVSGIGLVLLSYFTDDCNWDYCLMLND